MGEALREYVEQNDPLKRAKRAAEKIVKKSEKIENEESELCPGRQTKQTKGPSLSFKRQPLKAATKHQLNLRDRVQCTFTNKDGERCIERKWLAFHHIRPVSLGGANTINNLITLCWQHHDQVHQMRLSLR